MHAARYRIDIVEIIFEFILGEKKKLNIIQFSFLSNKIFISSLKFHFFNIFAYIMVLKSRVVMFAIRFKLRPDETCFEIVETRTSMA